MLSNADEHFFPWLSSTQKSEMKHPDIATACARGALFWGTAIKRSMTVRADCSMSVIYCTAHRARGSYMLTHQYERQRYFR